jgi:hypothetical protein
MFDLLGGAIPDRVTRLPLSLGGFSEAHTPRAREVLTEHGITPSALAREAVTFVDVVSLGSTFSRLFTLFDNWIVETREPWGVIRRHLRFVGVTWATKTSPNTWRWQQHADWTGRLPARSVVNVSMRSFAWSHLANAQPKLTRSFRPSDWFADDDGPDRGERTRQALAEAVALVAYGRSRDGRRAIARATDGEPGLREGWLRSLVAGLVR